MKFPFVSRNGELIPAEQAIISIDTAEVAYGFGVYETIKVRNNIVYFLPQHIDRLMNSARQINLEHAFNMQFIEQAILSLLQNTPEDSCNIKLLLYGNPKPEHTTLFIIPSAPLYPDRKWYRDGVSLISFEHERWMPQAKTLNMLPSYVMYKKAKEQGAYDALLYNRQRNLLEGTRTNIYVIKGKHIYSPPKAAVLEGVTMMTLEKVIRQTDYTITYKDIPMDSIGEYDGMFLSSTSTKILPVRKVDGREYSSISNELKTLITTYESAIDLCEGVFERL